MAACVYICDMEFITSPEAKEATVSATFTTPEGNVVSIDTLGAATTVHEYLFGAQSHRLSPEASVEVYLACDGFGDTSQPGELREQIREYMNGGWDWSHVRDSSPVGFYRAMQKIIELQNA